MEGEEFQGIYGTRKRWMGTRPSQQFPKLIHDGKNLQPTYNPNFVTVTIVVSQHRIFKKQRSTDRQHTYQGSIFVRLLVNKISVFDNQQATFKPFP